MKRLKKADYVIIAFLIVFLSSSFLYLIYRKNGRTSDTNHTKESILQVEDRPFSYYAEDKKIGAITGGLYEVMIQERFPDAEILQFNNQPDMAVALSSGIIDAFTCPRSSAEEFMKNDSSLTCLNEVFMEIPYGFAFQKSDNKEYLRDQMKEFLNKLHNEGTYDDIVSKWFGDDESVKQVDFSGLSGDNGVIRYITASTMQPFSYIANGENAGIEVDIITRFCREYGYDLRIDNAEFSSLIPGITSGMYDIASGTIMITEERAESVNFSDVYYTADAVAVVRKEEDAERKTDLKDTVASDFNGKRFGIKTGSSFEAVTLDNFPDSKYYYYDSTSDLITALENNKIDAFVEDEPVARMVHNEKIDVDYIHEPLLKEDYCFGFSKNSNTAKMLEEFNEYLNGIKTDGIYDALLDKWLGSDDSLKNLDEYQLSGKNGTLQVVVLPDNTPFSYYTSDKGLCGLAVEMALEFGDEYGYDIEFEQANVSSSLTGLSSGKYDILAGSLSVTEERKQTINFSDSFYNGGMVLVARSADITKNTSYTQQYITSPQQLNNKEYTVGVVNGTYGMFAVEELLPEAEVLMFSDHVTGYESVRQGQTDGFVYERSQMETAIENGLNGVELLPENLGEPSEIAVGISRKASVPDLQKKLNDFLAEIKEDGTSDDAYNRWVLERNYTMPDIPEPDSPSIKLTVGTTGLVEPFSFYANNELAGYDIELIKRFALYLNAEVEIRTYDFVGIVTAAESGDIDCIFSNLNKTPERMEVIDFSDPVYIAYNAVMVASSDDSSARTEKETWIGSIKTSFEKNFIRENRYKLILKGIGTTCIITVLSVILGSVLAFLICLFRRTDSILAGRIADIYVKLLQGTPMVVLLMILYYVVFSKSGLPAIWVAIIGFSLNFAAYVSETLQSGINSVDNGQREAALALGYSENQAFFRFIFPQAATRQLPVYRGEIISLLKSTSIVGYIAIQDLTKMSDIIRSRTYEAFFPLIATAFIYFILAWFISLILKLLMRKIDPRSVKKTVEGGNEK